MTAEEMERAIDFLLKSQASFEARLEQTNQQLAETNRQLAETNQQLAETNRQLAESSRQLQSYAETQTAFIQIVTRHIEAQGEINASFRTSLARIDEAIVKLAEAQINTDRRLDVLIEIVRERLNGNT